MSLKSAGSISPVDAAMRAVGPSFFHVGVFSTGVNFLMLTGSLYMLQIYDRVLSSRSVATLIGLSMLALACFALQGVLDAMRLKLLGRMGASFDQQLSPLVARATVTLPLRGVRPAETAQPMRDIDSIRGFLASMGPTALLDMPFMPLFVFAAFLLHPWFGWLTVAGVILIVALTWLTERAAQTPINALMRSAGERAVMLEAGRRNAEAIAGLGMAPAFIGRFAKVHERHVADSLALSDSTGGIGAFARVTRFVLQSAVLGLGAYLAIKGEVSAGAMIAASILTSRSLAPIEIAVANWKSFVAARNGYARLKALMPHPIQLERELDLPPPRLNIAVQDLSVVAPGTQRLIIDGVSFELKAGQGLGIIGPSGCGKSTLARALVGIWPAARGTVRLDGALLGQWERDRFGGFIGYLPQDVELFDGTIAENIARFAMDFRAEDVLAAARQAGAHDLIVSFPHGYDTRIGDSGAILSGGQRQRIALARALYGDPFLVVLDEPNASLDQDGDEALTQAVRGIRDRGGIVVVITHRASGLAAIDVVAAMSGGKLHAFGPREQVLQNVIRRGGMPTARRPQSSEAAPPPTADQGD